MTTSGWLFAGEMSAAGAIAAAPRMPKRSGGAVVDFSHRGGLAACVPSVVRRLAAGEMLSAYLLDSS